MVSVSTRPLRIANVSGFLGDRFTAFREMLGGPTAVDVITGDYLAELTMFILGKQQARDPRAGYADVFARQVAEVMGDLLSSGTRVVANAGGLNPRGLRDRLLDIAAEQGFEPRIAVVEGDDLRGRLAELQADPDLEFRHLDTGQLLPSLGSAAMTANAYLGGWGIASALNAGADIVVTGRVTDASLVLGPAASWHGWRMDDWNSLAGAVVAGHVIECGAQATGGNYPFLTELSPGLPGFPIAEISRDGTFVVTKQPGTAGAVTTGTVTAQLLYEIGQPSYANADVMAHFDGLNVVQSGRDRVTISGARGTPAPRSLKLAVNFPGGFRNTMTMVITGLEIEQKADHAMAQLTEALGGTDQFDEFDVQLLHTERPDATVNAEATALLRVTVKSHNPELVGRRFSNEVTALTLQSYAGYFATTPPTSATEYGIYWPALLPRHLVMHSVLFPDGTVHPVPDPPLEESAVTSSTRNSAHEAAPTDRRVTVEPTARLPLGTICGARSGDKGGNANVGLWCETNDAYDWLTDYLTMERLRELLPETESLRVERYELPTLRAVNFVIVGLLGEGVASSVRLDPQAKGLGEFVRSRLVDVPTRLIRAGFETHRDQPFRS